MVKILAIGNSFSEDATYYLHALASAGGKQTKVVNLYIGGCSLKTHWENILADAPLYLREENGNCSGPYVSIRQALEEDDWDFIVTQQASHFSGMPESYHPFLEQIVSYIRGLCPSARLLLQETWAYDPDSTHDWFPAYHNSQAEMYDRLKSAYCNAAQSVCVDLIPSGDVIQYLRERPPFNYTAGGYSLCRDGFHMSFVHGRFLLAAIWYVRLLGEDILKNPFVPVTDLTQDEAADPERLSTIRQAVAKLVSPLQ